MQSLKSEEQKLQRRAFSTRPETFILLITPLRGWFYLIFHSSCHTFILMPTFSSYKISSSSSQITLQYNAEDSTFSTLKHPDFKMQDMYLYLCMKTKLPTEGKPWGLCLCCSLRTLPSYCTVKPVVWCSVFLKEGNGVNSLSPFSSLNVFNVVWRIS